MKSEEEIDAWYATAKENALERYQNNESPSGEKEYRRHMARLRKKYDRAVERSIAARALPPATPLSRLIRRVIPPWFKKGKL